MDDGIGLAEKMLGLPGLKALDVEECVGKLMISVESIDTKARRSSCRRRAQAQDRVTVRPRDLHCFGRPCHLAIRKRRWRCRTGRCTRKTWTERIAGILPRHLVAHRAGAEIARQVGRLCRWVASVAAEYGVDWDTAWLAVPPPRHTSRRGPESGRQRPRPRGRRALLSGRHPGALDDPCHQPRRSRQKEGHRRLRGGKCRQAAAPERSRSVH